MGFFNQVKTAGAIFGWVTPGIERLADKGAVALAIVCLDVGQRDDDINNSWQFQPCF